MKHYGPVVGFVLTGEAQAEHFLAACRLVVTATSFGGVRTTAERRARWKGDAIPDSFIPLAALCQIYKNGKLCCAETEQHVFSTYPLKIV